MLIFSKLNDDSLTYMSAYLNLREFVALSESFSDSKKNAVYTQLIDSAKTKNILEIGDILIHIYPDLKPEKKTELYGIISSLHNQFDFHLRRHAMTLLALFLQKEYLTPTQQADACNQILQLCSDRNHDVKYQALNFMLHYFPQLSESNKETLVTLIENDCKDPLNTDIKAFSHRFLAQNAEHLNNQQENPFYAEFNQPVPFDRETDIDDQQPAARKSKL